MDCKILELQLNNQSSYEFRKLIEYFSRIDSQIQFEKNENNFVLLQSTNNCVTFQIWVSLCFFEKFYILKEKESFNTFTLSEVLKNVKKKKSFCLDVILRENKNIFKFECGNKKLTYTDIIHNNIYFKNKITCSHFIFFKIKLNIEFIELLLLKIENIFDYVDLLMNPKNKQMYFKSINYFAEMNIENKNIEFYNLLELDVDYCFRLSIDSLILLYELCKLSHQFYDKSNYEIFFQVKNNNVIEKMITNVYFTDMLSTIEIMNVWNNKI